MNPPPTTPPASTETPPVAELPRLPLKLANCGELSIGQREFTGWFHPIDRDTWAAIIGFHRAITLKHESESVSYHRWSEKEQRYHTLIPYQQGRRYGLSVSTNWQDPRNQKLLDDYGKEHGEDFFPACTIHTHVDVNAFESGTDAKDEENQSGWHITLGKLISSEHYDIDCRMRLPKVPLIGQRTPIDVPYALKLENILTADLPVGEATSMPGSTNWHHLLDRVEFNGSWGQQWRGQRVAEDLYHGGQPMGQGFWDY